MPQDESADQGALAKPITIRRPPGSGLAPALDGVLVAVRRIGMA